MAHTKTAGKRRNAVAIDIINDEKIQIERDGKIIDCDILFTFESDRKSVV